MNASVDDREGLGTWSLPGCEGSGTRAVPMIESTVPLTAPTRQVLLTCTRPLDWSV